MSLNIRLPCRRGEPICSPEVFRTKGRMRAHTQVRPYGRILFQVPENAIFLKKLLTRRDGRAIMLFVNSKGAVGKRPQRFLLSIVAAVKRCSQPRPERKYENEQAADSEKLCAETRRI